MFVNKTTFFLLFHSINLTSDYNISDMYFFQFFNWRHPTFNACVDFQHNFSCLVEGIPLLLITHISLQHISQRKADIQGITVISFPIQSNMVQTKIIKESGHSFFWFYIFPSGVLSRPRLTFRDNPVKHLPV